MSDEASSYDFDEPFADPQIQKDYEAALGAFLVVFNAIENSVSDLIHLALKKSDRKEIAKFINGDNFFRKLIVLDLLTIAQPRIASKMLIEKLRALGTERNNLAHGHFDQNPFDGNYQVVTNRKTRSIPIEQISKLTERAESACNELRDSVTFFHVEELF
jgi:hypothetical protein